MTKIYFIDFYKKILYNIYRKVKKAFCPIPTRKSDGNLTLNSDLRVEEVLVEVGKNAKEAKPLNSVICINYFCVVEG